MRRAFAALITSAMAGAWGFLPSEPPRLALTLNIPAYRLDVYENGGRTHSYTVAVGEVKYPSPRGSFAITHVE